MKVKISCFFRDSSEKDILLKITESFSEEIHRIMLAPHELQELKVAIEEYQENQPFGVLKDATGEENGE